jgi:hypothetical protein
MGQVGNHKISLLLEPFQLLTFQDIRKTFLAFLNLPNPFGTRAELPKWVSSTWAMRLTQS